MRRRVVWAHLPGLSRTLAPVDAEQNTPVYDLTPLEEWATKLHEMYSALRSAGFDDRQALKLVAAKVKG